MVQVRPKTQNKFRRDAWVEINLDNLEFNLNQIYNWTQKPLIPVLKADAYGHGAGVIAGILDSYDFVAKYAVASIDEALALRESTSKSIMVLGISPEWALEAALLNNIEITIVDLSTAAKLNEIAKANAKNQKIHIKLDTGMNRIGLKTSQEDFKAFISEIEKLENLEIETIFSHFSAPSDKDFTQGQLQLFEDITKGINYPRHIASSAAARELEETRFDFVRCGIELYGLDNPDLKPLLSLYSRISFVKDINAGEYVSYGKSWQAIRDTKLITLPLGYADGLRRNLSNKMQAFYKNSQTQGYIKQVGVITMDQVVFDVGDIESNTTIQSGDIVELIGPHIPITKWAKILDTISYELVCDLNLRLPKTYTRM